MLPYPWFCCFADKKEGGRVFSRVQVWAKLAASSALPAACFFGGLDSLSL
jgi:hypothetical protein